MNSLKADFQGHLKTAPNGTSAGKTSGEASFE